jgi:hypothetical protein
MNPSTTTPQRVFEQLVIALFVLLVCWSGLHLVIAAGWLLAPILLFAIPVAWLLTDLLSGISSAPRSFVHSVNIMAILRR